MTYRPPILLAIALAACTAQAAPPAHVLRPEVSLAAANRLLDATFAACHAQGKTLVAAVVDRGGNLVALQRDDNVGPHNTRAAQRKAYTALSTKTATGLLAENARANPHNENLTTVGELLLLGGGVPIKDGAEVIGAIGVAGAGGPAMDEACALTAISRVFSTSPN